MSIKPVLVQQLLAARSKPLARNPSRARLRAHSTVYRWFMSIALLCIAVSPREAEAQCTPITNGPISQAATLSVKTTDATCTLENGGYVKDSTTYKLHLSADVTGTCTSRVYQYPPGVCVNSTIYTRTIGTSSQNVDSTLVAYVVVNPSNTTTIQTYDTTGPTNTLSTGASWSTQTLGTHTYTSSTNANATPCNITPTSFAQSQAFTMNVLHCQPFFYDHQTPPVIMGHFGPNTISVYLDTPDLTSYLSNAISAWNTALSGTGVSFSAVSSPCTSNPTTCLTVTTGTPPGGRCGTTDSVRNATTGVIQSGAVITINSNWNAVPYSTAGLNRLFTHEIGHVLGLFDAASAPTCAISDAVLQPDFDCTASSLVYAPTTNDFLPISKTVYGGGTHSSCGF